MRIECQHFRECARQDGGCCELGLYGGQPSLGTCNGCSHNPSRGKWGPPIAAAVQLHIPTAEERAKAEAGRIAMLRSLWIELHWQASRGKLTPEWLNNFGGRVPCGDCRIHWGQILKDMPPVFGAGAFEWTWRAHQRVNERLGKPGITLDEARKLYPSP